MAKRQGGLPDNYIPRSSIRSRGDGPAGQSFDPVLLFGQPVQQRRPVVLAGGSSSVPGIDDLISERLGVETMIANPFANMAVASRSKPQVLSNDAPALMIACGLALRSFD